jgi:hypothetical protein
MESFPPIHEIDHPAMPKSRLNSLLIILMVTLFLSGGALIVLKQIDTYHRKQLYIATNAALPVHKAKLTKSNVEVKTFVSPEFGFVQEYAEFYESYEISPIEAFPVLNYEKGPKGYKKGYRFASSLSSVFCPVLEVLVYSTEEKTAANWLKVNTDIKGAFASQSAENINQIEFIKLTGPGGDMVPSEVYLALANKNLYQLNLNFGLKGDAVDPKCGNILSGFKLTGLTSAEWKTYKNEEYGFEMKIPSEWIVEETPYTVMFSTPENKKLAEENKKNCETGKNECNPEFNSPHMFFSNKDYSKTDIIQQEFNINVNGTVWYKYAIPSLGDPWYYKIEHNNKIYNFIIKKEQFEPIFFQILSTLRFTEKADTSTWKTYRNEEYGFEFKYPLDFTIFEGDSYQLQGAKNELVDVFSVQIINNSNKEVKLTYLINTPGSGCGEGAERISSISMEASSLGITKDVYLWGISGSKCFDYSGFGKGYIIASIPKNYGNFESVFDKIVLSIKFTK